MLSSGIPLWAAAEVSPGDCSSSTARERLDQFDSGTGRPRVRDSAVVKERLSLSKQRIDEGRPSRLEPLLTIGQTAAILNLSARTVRRLITSGSIRAVWIGRSVRLRPRDIERLIAEGVDCSD
jgi:excisionase family DNA binding protein